jgi:hypothetical protein
VLLGSRTSAGGGGRSTGAGAPTPPRRPPAPSSAADQLLGGASAALGGYLAGLGRSGSGGSNFGGASFSSDTSLATSNAYYPGGGTYTQAADPSLIDQSGNTLTDLNTGDTLVYGTD